MVLKKIRFPTYLEDIKDIEDDNIDVFVELEDGYVHTLVVATAKNIETIMDQEEMNYLRTGHPFIIVKELTKEIIEEAVKAYADQENGYWLKSYHFAEKIDKTVFAQLQTEHIEYLKELDELAGLDELNNS